MKPGNRQDIAEMVPNHAKHHCFERWKGLKDLQYFPPFCSCRKAF